MSVAERALASRRPLKRRLCGWGGVSPSVATVLQPRAEDEIMDALASPAARATGLIARGAGRSYGDAAQIDGGVVLDMRGWDQVHSIDRERGVVTAGAGATIGQLLRTLAPHGLTLPVVPGTSQVTIAGAIASDIHGKSHHRDGGFARHVVSLSLCTPARGRVTLSAEADEGLFYATLGGMGLTGVIVEATLSVEVLGSPRVAVEVRRSAGLEQTLELLSEPESHRYSVAWLDLLARGAAFGRGVVMRAEDASGAEEGKLPRLLRRDWLRPGSLAPGPLLDVPRRFPGALLSSPAVRAFNSLNWRLAPRRPRTRLQARGPFFFPLDRLGEWHRLYGAQGMLQYQFVVPTGQEDELVRCAELMRSRQLPVFLAVFKRMGAEFGGPLSFPLAGWTLAVDMAAGARDTARVLDELDAIVAGCGGRVYLTKDARLSADRIAAMYPKLDAFRRECARADPDGVLASDLSRRLGLTEAGR
jgi:decaprenylphospho-beta-D-ribofuranose 2-oxidase